MCAPCFLVCARLTTCARAHTRTAAGEHCLQYFGQGQLKNLMGKNVQSDQGFVAFGVGSIP